MKFGQILWHKNFQIVRGTSMNCMDLSSSLNKHPCGKSTLLDAAKQFYFLKRLDPSMEKVFPVIFDSLVRYPV